MEAPFAGVVADVEVECSYFGTGLVKGHSLVVVVMEVVADAPSCWVALADKYFVVVEVRSKEIGAPPRELGLGSD